MNIHEINEAIRELENGPTTYHNCMKLASLYIVRDMYGKGENKNFTMYGDDHRMDRSRYGYEPMYDDMHMMDRRSSMF